MNSPILCPQFINSAEFRIIQNTATSANFRAIKFPDYELIIQSFSNFWTESPHWRYTTLCYSIPSPNLWWNNPESNQLEQSTLNCFKRSSTCSTMRKCGNSQKIRLFQTLFSFSDFHRNIFLVPFISLFLNILLSLLNPTKYNILLLSTAFFLQTFIHETCATSNLKSKHLLEDPTFSILFHSFSVCFTKTTWCYRS